MIYAWEHVYITVNLQIYRPEKNAVRYGVHKPELNIHMQKKHDKKEIVAK